MEIETLFQLGVLTASVSDSQSRLSEADTPTAQPRHFHDSAMLILADVLTQMQCKINKFKKTK